MSIKLNKSNLKDQCPNYCFECTECSVFAKNNFSTVRNIHVFSDQKPQTTKEVKNLSIWELTGYCAGEAFMQCHDQRCFVLTEILQGRAKISIVHWKSVSQWWADDDFLKIDWRRKIPRQWHLSIASATVSTSYCASHHHQSTILDLFSTKCR